MATIIEPVGVDIGEAVERGRAVPVRRSRFYLWLALVCAAAVISTPYVLDYDLVILLPALAWLWLDGREHGFHRWDATLMAAAWFVPLSAREIAEYIYVPVGLICPLAIAFIALRRFTASPCRRSHVAFAL